jgi:predicted aspartyl protease
MTFRFNPQFSLIAVRTELFGPTGKAIVTLALDTGATRTQINTEVLVSLGYDPATATEHSRVITGNGIIDAPHLTVQKLKALGQERQRLTVTCFTLPKGAGVDGLLGLDFFRGLNLNIDFRSGLIALS